MKPQGVSLDAAMMWVGGSLLLSWSHVFGRRIPSFAGPYIIYNEYVTPCDYGGNGVIAHVRSSPYNPFKPYSKQLLTGNMTLEFPLDDTLVLHLKMDVFRNNEWKQNSMIMKFPHACSTLRDDLPDCFILINDNKPAAKNAPCRVEAGFHELNRSTDFTFPRFPVLPYGRYRLHINIGPPKKVDSLCFIMGGRGGGSSVPTLVITQCGFDYDECGGDDSISGGDVPVALALKCPLPAGGRKRLCEALRGKSLGLTFCKDRRLKARAVLPADIEACLAPVPDGRKEMRPGAVTYQPSTGELMVYLRKSASAKERAGCKLFGYLLREGLSTLSFKHTGGCTLCRKGFYVSLEFEQVKFQDEDEEGDDEADSPDEASDKD